MSQCLLLLENPPESAFDNCAFFRHFGFEVRGYPLDDIFGSTHLRYFYYGLQRVIRTGSFDFLQKLIRRHYKSYREIPKFHDFDIVVIFVNSAGKLPVSRAILKKVKRKILWAERRRQSNIHLLGIDLSSPQEFAPEQEKFFDGLFLVGFPFRIAEKAEQAPPISTCYMFRSQIVSFERMEMIMSRLLSRSLNEYEKKYLEIHFPREQLLKGNDPNPQNSA